MIPNYLIFTTTMTTMMTMMTMMTDGGLILGEETMMTAPLPACQTWGGHVRHPTTPQKSFREQADI